MENILFLYSSIDLGSIFSDTLFSVSYYFDIKGITNLLIDLNNKLIHFLNETITGIYIYVCYNIDCIFESYYYIKKLYLSIILEALSFLGLGLIIFILIYIFYYIYKQYFVMNSDDESANNSIVLSRHSKNRLPPVVPPAIPSDPNDPDEDHALAATSLLMTMWYIAKQDDMRNNGHTIEWSVDAPADANRIEETNVITSPSEIPVSFTHSDALSILHYNKLYCLYDKYYNVSDERYYTENVLLHQDVRKAYGSNSETVENLLREFLRSNNRIIPTDEEERPHTRDVWAANLPTDPPIMQGLPNSRPILPCNGVDLADIPDPYMHTAVKVIVTDIYHEETVNDLNQKHYQTADIIDEKKLTDLKYIFLFYKSAGNSDLSWEKAVTAYALHFHKNSHLWVGEDLNFQTYMKMLDFVDIMDKTRKRNNNEPYLHG